MSAIRARYDGPSGTGVEITVELESNEIRTVHVPKGGLLPTDVDGTPIRASFRDQLLATDDWNEQRQPTAQDKAAKDPDHTNDKKGS